MNYVIDKNAKNVWIRDNNDTIDLSPETDASTVYLNNGRTLEQELGEGSMVSNVVTVNSATSKVIDGTYDGAYESLVFKGRSLVNLYDMGKVINPVPNANVRVEHDSITLTSSNAWCVANNPLQNLKENTQYTIVINVLEYSLVNGVLNVEIDSGNTIFESGFKIASVGLHKRLVLTKTGFTGKNRSDIRLSNTTSTGSVKFQYMLLEGDYTNIDIPYFEGLCDVKMPVVKNVGKNLFNKDTAFSGWVDDQTGVITKRDIGVGDNIVSDFIKIMPTEVYVMNTSVYQWYYTENKKYIKKVISIGVDIIPPKNARYVIIAKSISNQNPQYHSILSSMQLERGSIVTSYEPYKSNTLITPEEIILRSLPNGVQDTYNPLTGEYVKRVGEIVLDGSDDEYWGLYNRDYSQWTTRQWSLKLPLTALASAIPSQSLRTICDKLKFGGIASGEDYEHYRTVGGDADGLTNYAYIFLDKNKATTVRELKLYLQSSPITIQYELAAPIIKKVDQKGYPFAYENGHVILESGYQGQSLLPIMDYSTVINRTGQIKSIGEQSLRQDKQINKLEQMLVGNIIAMNYNNTLLKLNLTMNEVK